MRSGWTSIGCAIEPTGSCVPISSRPADSPSPAASSEAASGTWPACSASAGSSAGSSASSSTAVPTGEAAGGSWPTDSSSAAVPLGEAVGDTRPACSASAATSGDAGRSKRVELSVRFGSAWLGTTADSGATGVGLSGVGVLARGGVDRRIGLSGVGVRARGGRTADSCKELIVRQYVK